MPDMLIDISELADKHLVSVAGASKIGCEMLGVGGKVREHNDFLDILSAGNKLVDIVTMTGVAYNVATAVMVSRAMRIDIPEEIAPVLEEACDLLIKAIDVAEKKGMEAEADSIANGTDSIDAEWQNFQS